MAKAIRGTELALIPCRIGRDRWRHPVVQGDTATTFDGLYGYLTVVIDPLGIHPVIVLADGNVYGLLDVSAVHIDLHLHKMLPL